jgi:four helix bundle protein
MKEDNVVMIKSKALALRVVKLYRFLTEEKKEFVISKQVLRSGTSIGANIKESECAQSKADFKTKLYVAFKEANETEYWLELLHESGYLAHDAFESIYSDCKEVKKLLSSITKTIKDGEGGRYN